MLEIPIKLCSMRFTLIKVEAMIVIRLGLSWILAADLLSVLVGAVVLLVRFLSVYVAVSDYDETF